MVAIQFINPGQSLRLQRMMTDNMITGNPKKILFYYPDQETKLASTIGILLIKAV